MFFYFNVDEKVQYQLKKFTTLYSNTFVKSSIAHQIITYYIGLIIFLLLHIFFIASDFF